MSRFLIAAWFLGLIGLASAEMLSPIATFKVDGRISDNRELSGIAKIGDTVLICGDESNTGQFLEIDAASQTIKPGKKVKFVSGPELDAEGIATDGTTFWVTGSHGISRKSQEYKPERFVFVRLDANGRQIGKGTFSNAIASNATIGSAFRRKLQGNGANVEGLTYWNGKLYIGLRAPSDSGSAYMLSMDPSVALASGEAHSLHSLNLGDGYGVRSLETTSRGILILTGASDPDGGKQAKIYEWRGGGASYKATLGGLSGKPEALLLLSESGSAFDLLVFSDGEDNGAPTLFRVPK